MWIITQNDNYVNSNNIYSMSIEECCDYWGVFAYSTYETRVKLGEYSTQEIAEHALDIFIDCVGLNYAGYVMPIEEDVLRDMSKKHERSYKLT